MIAGIPSLPTGAVCQKSEPRHSDAFSSSVSSEIRLMKSFEAVDTTNSSERETEPMPNHIIANHSSMRGASG